jgi:hypothetical protein
MSISRERGRAGVAACVYLALTCALCLSFASTAFAVDPGAGGWYWPLGHDHASAGTWPQYRGWYPDSPAWHVAFDDIGTWKQPVYAAADGVVLESRTDVGGYGPGGGKGGAMVIAYRTADGTDFTALYGHVESLRFSQGQNVRAGDVICLLNNYAPPHVHFGIHLGLGYPAPSAEQTATNYVGIMMGHTHESTLTSAGVRVPILYDWVDPVAFLNSHTPSAPPVPTITKPKGPSTARRRRTFTATGYLAPRHRAGRRDVVVEALRLEGSRWVRRAKVTALSSNSGSRTKYTARIKLTLKGRYRLRAYIPGDAAHQAAYSSEWSMRVR